VTTAPGWFVMAADLTDAAMLSRIFPPLRITKGSQSVSLNLFCKPAVDKGGLPGAETP